jgi:hypothetical protein
MKQVLLDTLKYLAKIVVLSSVSGVAIGLVLFSIFSSAGITFHDIQDMTDEYWSEKAIRPEQAKRADEVRSYSLFKTVEFGEYTATTGIRYASTTVPDIEHQWCYISDGEQAGRSRPHLTLATKTANGNTDIPDFETSALAEFGLTRISVQALITSHCRCH